MSEQEHQRDGLVQPVRAEPVWQPVERPPLDWGDEEPDRVWERLYYKGLVDPPYRSREDRQSLMQTIRGWQPIGKPMTNEELMCALGRCRCDRCR